MSSILNRFGKVRHHALWSAHRIKLPGLSLVTSPPTAPGIRNRMVSQTTNPYRIAKALDIAESHGMGYLKQGSPFRITISRRGTLTALVHRRWNQQPAKTFFARSSLGTAHELFKWYQFGTALIATDVTFGEFA